MDVQNYRNYHSSLRTLLNQALVEALKRNEAHTKTWRDYKKAHEKVKKGLEILPQELTTNCMVPIGRKALMKGKLVHTNEILVCLGEGYFAKYSAKQASAVCDRRIKQADEMLMNLEKEKHLLEMRQSLPIDSGIFGDDKQQEIIETYDEEEEKEWRIKHRRREKEYRQKLAQLRAQEKTQIQSEEDLWQRLDELELQEELEDEIDRLDEVDCNYYGRDNEEGDSYEEEDCEFSEDETSNDVIQERLEKLKNSKIPKHQKDLFEKENLNKEMDRDSSLTHDVPNTHQPSSSTSLDTNTFVIGSSRETIDGIKPEDSLSSLIDQQSTDSEQTMNENNRLMIEDIRDYNTSQSSTSSLSTSEGASTYVKDSNSLKSSTLSETDIEQSILSESESRQIMEKRGKEDDELSSGNNNGDDNNQDIGSDTRKRRVSFTDKIKVNVFGKWKNESFDKPLMRGRESSSESDVENEIEKSEIIEDMISVGADLSSIDEPPEDSTEHADEEDNIIRIEFKHSKRRRKTSPKLPGDDTIEDPSDIYRVFWKPKSILKKSSSDVIHSQDITPPADDVFDQDEELPFGSSYTIIVKDVEERKPEVIDVNVSKNKTRPPSRFKMTRSGIKQ